jgi:hypothetical protein
VNYESESICIEGIINYLMSLCRNLAGGSENRPPSKNTLARLLILTKEFEVDLGSYLCWGKSTLLACDRQPIYYSSYKCIWLKCSRAAHVREYSSYLLRFRCSSCDKLNFRLVINAMATC